MCSGGMATAGCLEFGICGLDITVPKDSSDRKCIVSGASRQALSLPSLLWLKDKKSRFVILKFLRRKSSRSFSARRRPAGWCRLLHSSWPIKAPCLWFRSVAGLEDDFSFLVVRALP